MSDCDVGVVAWICCVDVGTVGNITMEIAVATLVSVFDLSCNAHYRSLFSGLQ